MSEIIRNTIEALQKRNIEALYASDRNVAREELIKIVASDDTVGIGGSMTIQELDVVEELEKQGSKVIWHWMCPPEDMMEVRKEATRAKYFCCSTNALTYDGRLVNIDGIGNRASAMFYGPETVVVVAGHNKLTADLDSALERIKNVACPLNARRLNLDTPCAREGKCIDCNHAARMCNIITIIERKPLLTDLKVILVDDELGF